MHEQQPLQGSQPTRRFPVGLVAALSVVVVAAGAGTAWWSWNSIGSQPDNPPVSTEEPANSDATASNEPTPTDPATPAVQSTAQVYLLDVAGDRFELVPSTIELDSAAEPDAILTAAFERLLTGAVESEAFSEIPANTELLGLSVESDGVHVNLSSEFETGGGSASMTGRLAQVIYTASSLEPTAPVWLSVDGEPLEVLGGEGLMIDQPMTRAQFEDNFSL